MVGPYDSEAALMSEPLLVLDDDMWPLAVIEVNHDDFMGCDTIVRGWMTMRDDDLHEEAKAKYDVERGRRWMYPPVEDEEGPFNYERQRSARGKLMGDRANILVKYDDDDPGVYLYTHWGGSGLPEDLQYALGRKERWTDAPYLTRIIFCAMVRGNESGTTGYGISSCLTDGQERTLVVHCAKRMVFYEGWSCTFQEFVDMEDVKSRMGGRV